MTINEWKKISLWCYELSMFTTWDTFDYLRMMDVIELMTTEENIPPMGAAVISTSLQKILIASAPVKRLDDANIYRSVSEVLKQTGNIKCDVLFDAVQMLMLCGCKQAEGVARTFKNLRVKKQTRKELCGLILDKLVPVCDCGAIREAGSGFSHLLRAVCSLALTYGGR